MAGECSHRTTASLSRDRSPRVSVTHQEEIEKLSPYRHTQLLKILDNAFGGNSITSVICNISLSDHESTLSSLRFAVRAGRIQNRAVVNKAMSEARSLLRKRDKEIASTATLVSVSYSRSL